MKKSVAKVEKSDADAIEMMEDLERIPSRPKESDSAPIVSIQGKNFELVLEAIDSLPDGRLKINFVHGVELILDPQHKALKGKGLSFRIGTMEIKAARVQNCIQLTVDALQINIQR